MLKKDEWTIYAHSKIDYSTLCEEDFIKSISDYMIFQAKKNSDILDKDLSEAELFFTLNSYFKNEDGNLTKNKKKNSTINTNGWKEFTLCGNNGLFIYQHGSRLVVPQRVIGDIPLITAGKINQGYAQSISNYDDEECFEPGITIDMFANCFYQNFRFAADDNIYIFNKPQKINKYIALFLVAIINKQQYRYGYGRQFRKDDTEINKFLLPVAKDGQPDWEFMENYIKNLPYGDLI